MDVGRKALGVIGTGTIGRHVVQLLRGFEMEVLAHDSYGNSDWARPHGVGYAEFQSVLARAVIWWTIGPLMRTSKVADYGDTVATYQGGKTPQYVVNR